ncbi:MAG: protease [Candidatus Binatota bacterium]|jgi:protease-4|nr:protease [Candidatus Binatota bacterium]
MRWLGRLIRRILTAGFVLLLLLLAVAGYEYFTGKGVGFLGENAVAVVYVEGEIDDPQDVVDTIDRVAESEGVRAIVIRIDSPGGAVAPSQEIYDAIVRARERKPVIASLGTIAASGGYYVAAACDRVVANAGTLTGSIGVLMQVGNVEELLKKIGVAGTILKAGKFKDIGSPVRAMTAEEHDLLVGLLENVHEQFIAAVAKGRRLGVDAVRAVADGRVLTGEQALEHGLVDRLGGLRDALDLAASEAGIEGGARPIEFRERSAPWWWEVLGRVLVPPQQHGTGLRFLYTGPPPPA